MSSVISFERCPVCGQEEALYSDFNVRTQEEKCFCHICGLQLEYYIDKDENGNDMRPLSIKEKVTRGAGVISIKYRNTYITQMLTVTTDKSEEDVKSKMEEIKREFDVEKIHATWFNEDTKEVKHLS